MQWLVKIEPTTYNVLKQNEKILNLKWLFEPTTYNVLKQRFKMLSTTTNLNQRHIMYWNNDRNWFWRWKTKRLNQRHIMYWNRVVILVSWKDWTLNQRHIMYWNSLTSFKSCVIRILNQRHIMYWNRCYPPFGGYPLIEPTTYNVLKLN